MRIVVSGTHASGKSTLISDFLQIHPEFATMGDPFDSIDDLAAAGVDSFAAQFRLASARLIDRSAGESVIVERGPLDFLAYLIALGDLGRADTSALVQSGVAPARRAMDTVDLLVVLPHDPIVVGADEDPRLRRAMADALLELVDDPDLVGSAHVVELSGSPSARVTALDELLGAR